MSTILIIVRKTCQNLSNKTTLFIEGNPLDILWKSVLGFDLVTEKMWINHRNVDKLLCNMGYPQLKTVELCSFFYYTPSYQLYPQSIATGVERNNTRVVEFRGIMAFNNKLKFSYE